MSFRAVLMGDEILFRGEYLTLDGTQVFTTERHGAVSDAQRMGLDGAAEVKAKRGSLIARP